MSCDSPIGGGVAAKLQTHWANNADNGLFWRNGSALWRNGRASVRWLIDAALHGVMLASVLAAGPSTGSVNPSMRSYTHLVEAGRGRPTTPATTPATQSVDKGKWLSGQGRDKH